ncbi:hypothetical protein MP228_009207 [Amoeboaphelidium protococcarum]|nr:hypothetical protein MP228_009207 [Amoeboaphelidium protococcarum]
MPRKKAAAKQSGDGSDLEDELGIVQGLVMPSNEQDNPVAGVNQANQLGQDNNAEDDDEFDTFLEDPVMMPYKNAGDTDLDEQQRALAQAQKMKMLMDQMTPGQLQRYELFRSCGFPKGGIRRVVQQTIDALNGSNQTQAKAGAVSEKVAIVVGGAAKMFVGEVIEAAIDVRQRFCAQNGIPYDDSVPLTPQELRYGYLALQQRRKSTYNLN